MGLLQRLDRDGHHVDGRGFRLVLPLLIWSGRGYDAARSRVHYGWWTWNLALSVERLGYRTQFVGFRLALTWGSQPLGVAREASA